MKIIHIADLHISGKNYERAKQALEQVKEFAIEHQVNIIVFSGDVFDKYNIADRHKTVGDLQALLLDFMVSSMQYYFLVGNHDYRGNQRSALEFLRHIPNSLVVDKPMVWPLNRVDFGFLPWVDKAQYVANFCQGMSKTDSDARFNERVHEALGIFQFTPGRQSILFGHIDVSGTKVNDGYTVENDGYTFNSGMLDATGANKIFLGHIHKRQGFYTGALYQQRLSLG